MRRTGCAALFPLLCGIALILSGCTPLPESKAAGPATPHAATTHAPAPSEAARKPASSAAPADVTVAPLPQGIIGTGTLVLSDGEADGTVTFTSEGGWATARLNGFTTVKTGQLDLSLSPYPARVPCDADRYNFVMNPLDAETKTWSLPMMDGTPFGTDPTYIKSVALRADTDAGKPNPAHCVYPVLATATIKWSIVPTRIRFTVADHGPRAGATGVVTVARDAPSTYTVAQGDTVAAIAARLGISAAALYFLNPYAGALDPDQAGAAANLTYGTVLNLALANRGAPPS